MPAADSHHLVGQYVTHQPDGVHIEARCECGVEFEGMGEDLSEAIMELWGKFVEHCEIIEK